MKFYKYHGTGNDFIVLDNRTGEFDAQNAQKIKALCHRRFGLGADGILLLENSRAALFKMVYLNSDGSSGSMCGNGGRCIVHFAHHVLKIIPDPQNIRFEAVDGMHEARILEDGNIKLKMQDVKDVSERNGLPFVCQGTTPHNIIFVENIEKFPVLSEGRKIRNSDPEGVNVNFVEIKDEVIHMRTYERGVEDETWACGTGATAVAIASHHLGKLRGLPRVDTQVKAGNTAYIKMPGGELKIEFEKIGDRKYKNIWLTGPATLVYEGEIN